MSNVINILIRARDKTKPIFGALMRQFSKLGDVIQGAAGSALSGLMSLVSSGLTGLITILVAAVVGLGVALVALAPALYLVGGAMGSMLTAAVGAGAAFAVLKLGTSGVSDALKELFENGKVTAETLRKLSPAARDFVLAFRGMRSALGPLKRAVQERLFAGLGKEIQQLAFRWMPVLQTALGGTADTLNRFARRVSGALKDFGFRTNIQQAIHYFNLFLDRVGQGTPRLVLAIGSIAKAAGPFLYALGDLIAGLMEKFGAFIAQAEKSTALAGFFERATATFKTIIAIGGQVFSIIGSIVQILFPTSEKVSGNIFDAALAGLQQISKWLSDPKNQKALRDAVEAGIQFLVNLPKYIEEAKKFAKEIRGIVDAIGTIVKPIAWLTRAVSGQFLAILAAARSVSNAISAAWNSLPVRIVRGFVGIAAKITMFFVSLPGYFVSVGSGIVSGIARGITGRWGWLLGVTAGLAASLLSAAKKKLGIASPSKAFADEVGRWIPAGIAQGIQRYGSVAQDALDGLGFGGGRTASASGSGGSGVLLEVRSGGSAMDDLLVEILRKSIRVRGGNVQAVLGRA